MELRIVHNYDKVTDVVLEPEENESEDMLYQLAQMLRVQNPAISFTKEVKAGKYNYLSDDEYDIVLQRIKYISECFFNKGEYSNIFQLLVNAMKYMMQYDKYLKDFYLTKSTNEDPKAYDRLTVDEMMSFYTMNANERSVIYSHINEARSFSFKECGDIEIIDYVRDHAKFRVPDNCMTTYIDAGDSLAVLTFYDPSGENTCIDYGTQYDDDKYVIEDTEEFIINTILIQKDSEFDDEKVLKYFKSGKPVHWYNFVQDQRSDGFVYESRLEFIKKYDGPVDIPMYYMKVIRKEPKITKN